ncbi:entericidin A/B family lipoprotein [Aliiglaciecola sp. LCG003]|nr:entericidin A/B family lipoprotein [Aliiglaciecola sp. LCG003]WJG11034.1 entericidin A/B family lipoprotein [Aliiglaciecola sp. LCG003]
MDIKFKKLKNLFIIAIVTASLGACATIEGVGKDVESAGEAVQDAADGE